MKIVLASLALVVASGASADTVLVDSFTAGSSFTLSNSNGTAAHNFITGESSILGGSRQVRVRAPASGFAGSSNITINVTAGTLTSFGGDANERFAQYGSAIGVQTLTGAGTVAPVDLNLNLNLADAVVFDVSAMGTNALLAVTLYVNGTSLSFDSGYINVTSAGTYSVALSQFSGLTESFADDVDGFILNFPSGGVNAAAGLTVDEVRIETAAVPEPSSFAAIAGLAALGWVSARRRRA